MFTYKTPLLFLILLLLIFAFDTVLYNVLWSSATNIVRDANLPYLRIIIFRVISLAAIFLAVATLSIFVNQRMQFYLFTTLAYIALDALWLLSMTKDSIDFSTTIGTLLTYAIQFVFAVMCVTMVLKITDKAKKKSRNHPLG